MLLHEKAELLGVVIGALDIQPACVYVAIEAPPTIAPHSIICGLKAHTSSALRREYRELTTIPTLWTREYLVAAGEGIGCEYLVRLLAETTPPRRARVRPPCRPS